MEEVSVDLICTEQLEELQNCTICLEEIRRPVVLECKHSFCLYCLHKWTLTTKTCPNCRVDVNPEKIPVTGLSDLENFHDAENDVEELQRPVYFMSEASRLEVTTMDILHFPIIPESHSSAVIVTRLQTTGDICLDAFAAGGMQELYHEACLGWIWKTAKLRLNKF